MLKFFGYFFPTKICKKWPKCFETLTDLATLMFVQVFCAKLLKRVNFVTKLLNFVAKFLTFQLRANCLANVSSIEI